MPHRMETVLVAEAPGQPVDWDLARDLLQNPAARIIACDPIAFQGALRINENVVTTKAFLTPTDGSASSSMDVGASISSSNGPDCSSRSWRSGRSLFNSLRSKRPWP